MINSFLSTKLHFIIAFVLYLIAPKQYSYFFCISLCILFLLIAYKSIMYGFKCRCYISFNLIFMFSLFLCTFIIPLFLYPTGYFLFTGYEQYINECTSLVVLAASVYSLGWQYGYQRIESKQLEDSLIEQGMSPFPIKVVTVVNIISVASVVYYYITFGETIKAGLDNSDLAAPFYTTILQTVLTLSIIVNIVSDVSEERSITLFLKNHIIISVCFSISIILPIIIGDRTMPIYLLSVFGTSYILLYKRIKITHILFGVFCVSVLMYVIGQTRNSTNAIKYAGASGAANTISEAITNTEDMSDTFQDFLPASNCLYLFKNWRETHNEELLYPGKIFILPFSPIPYFPTILTASFYDKSNLNEILSSDLSAFWYKNTVSNLDGGIGTHVVGDVYVSWGIFGVIFIFFLFGIFIAYGELLSKRNIYWCIAYITYVGQAMYIARGTVYFCYRHFVLQIFLLFLICTICGCQIKSNK